MAHPDLAPEGQRRLRWLLVTAARRQALYALGLAVLSVLAAYGVITAEEGEQWKGLLTAGLAALAASGHVTALRHVTPDPEPAESEDADA